MARYQIQVTKATDGSHSSAAVTETVGSGDLVMSFDKAKIADLNAFKRAMAEILHRVTASGYLAP